MVELFVIGLFLLAIFDAGIIAALVVNLIKQFFGETPLSRLFDFWVAFLPLDYIDIGQFTRLLSFGLQQKILVQSE